MHKSCNCFYNVFKQVSCMGSNLGLEESADKMFLKTIPERWKCTPKNRSALKRTAVTRLFDMQAIKEWVGRSYFVQHIFKKSGLKMV